MKRVAMLTLTTVVAAVSALALTPFSDSFDYTTGSNLDGQGGWVQFAGSGGDQLTIADLPTGSTSGVNVVKKPIANDSNETAKNIGTVDVDTTLEFHISVLSETPAGSNDALIRIVNNQDPFTVGTIVFQMGINDGKATGQTFSPSVYTQLDDSIEANTWYEFRATYNVFAGGDTLSVDYRRIGDPAWISIIPGMSVGTELSTTTDNSFRLTGRGFSDEMYWDDAGVMVTAAPEPPPFKPVTEPFDYTAGALGTSNGWAGTGTVFGHPDLFVQSADNGSVSGDLVGGCDPADAAGGLGATQQPIGAVTNGQIVRVTSTHLYGNGTGTNTCCNHQSQIWLSNSPGFLDRVLSFGLDGYRIGGFQGTGPGSVAPWQGALASPDTWYELEFTYYVNDATGDTYDLRHRPLGGTWTNQSEGASVPAALELSRSADNYLSMILEDSADTTPETKTSIDDINLFLVPPEPPPPCKDVSEPFDYTAGALGTQNGWAGTGNVFGLGHPDLFVQNADNGSLSGDPVGGCDPADTEGGLGATLQPIGAVTDGQVMTLTSTHMYGSGNPCCNHQSQIWLSNSSNFLTRVVSFGTDGARIGGFQSSQPGSVSPWTAALTTAPDTWYEFELTYYVDDTAGDTYDLRYRPVGGTWSNQFTGVSVPDGVKLLRGADNYLAMILEDSSDTVPETKGYIDDISLTGCAVEFSLTGISLETGGSITVEWQSESGQVYEVRKNAAIAAAFNPIATVTGAAATATHTDTNTVDAQGNYRVNLAP